MTREEIILTRDGCMESILYQMPGNNGTPHTSDVHLNFVTLLVMVHGACCRQLDNLRDADGLITNAKEFLRIADRIEKALPLHDAWANVVLAELGRLRKIVNDKPTKTTADPKI